METETKETASWRKNKDNKYISGEDLNFEVNGLKKEMIVQIVDFDNDAETFDQNENKKKIKTALYLKEVGGEKLHKPTLLNTINGKFFEKETGTDKLIQWIGFTAIMYALKDSRHGHVVRFKKYVLPVLVKGTQNFTNCHTAIHKNGFTMDQIRKKYQVSSEVEQLLMVKEVGNG